MSENTNSHIPDEDEGPPPKRGRVIHDSDSEGDGSEPGTRDVSDGETEENQINSAGKGKRTKKLGAYHAALTAERGGSNSDSGTVLAQDKNFLKKKRTVVAGPGASDKIKKVADRNKKKKSKDKSNKSTVDGEKSVKSKQKSSQSESARAENGSTAPREFNGNTDHTPIVLDSDVGSPIPPKKIVRVESGNVVDEHRMKMKGRAKKNNAAENKHFKGKKALIYHFLEISKVKEDEMGRLVTCELHCGICGKGPWHVSKKTQGSTTNYIGHLNSQHQGIWRDATKADDEVNGRHTKEAGEDIKLFMQETFKLDELYERIMRYIVIKNRPFTDIESDELLDIICYGRPPSLREKIVGADQLKNKILQLGEEVNGWLKEYFESDDVGKVAFAGDAWTSPNRIAFMSIVGQWITKNWELEECMVDFAGLHGAHDGENLGHTFMDALREIGLVDKFLTLTADNASNNGTQMKEIARQLLPVYKNRIRRMKEAGTIPADYEDSDMEDDELDPEKFTIRCLPHIIHLAVLDFLTSIKAISKEDAAASAFEPHPMTADEAEANLPSPDDSAPEPIAPAAASVPGQKELPRPHVVITKIRNIAKLVRSSPQRYEVFKAAVKRLDETRQRRAAEEKKEYQPRVKGLILDVVTRWHSMMMMMERGLEFKDVIDDLCKSEGHPYFAPYRLSKDEWKLAETLCGWLKMFQRASLNMAASSRPTLSSSMNSFVVLLDFVDEIKQSPTASNNPSVRAGIEACKDKLLKWFDRASKETEYYYFATVLDPSYKDALFRNEQNEELFCEEWVRGCHKSFVKTFNLEYADKNSHEDPDARANSVANSDAKVRFENRSEPGLN